jgi:hypothetical protein
MVSLETAILFVRHDLIQSYVDSGVLKKGEELPFDLGVSVWVQLQVHIR